MVSLVAVHALDSIKLTKAPYGTTLGPSCALAKDATQHAGPHGRFRNFSGAMERFRENERRNKIQTVPCLGLAKRKECTKTKNHGLKPMRVSSLVILACCYSLVDSADVCTVEVINPDCSNYSALASTKCIPASQCNDSAFADEEVGCSNWFCSLRINCGCFAGLDTSCARGNSVCSKAGCGLISQMFLELNCSVSNMLGFPADEDTWSTYMHECLDGCESAASRATLCSSFVLLGGLLYVGMVHDLTTS